MAQTMVNFRIDEEVKRKMESACKEMGLSISTAFNIFAIKVGNERRIPFEVAADTFYKEKQNAEYLAKLNRANEDMKNGGV